MNPFSPTEPSGDHTDPPRGRWWPGSRWAAAGWHLCASALIAAGVATAVLGWWYPGVYRALSGGIELLWIVVAVDVAIGPFLTLAVYDLRKPMRLIRMDLAVIASLQVLALFYGVWTAFQARPVFLVFEYDRFRVVHASDVAIEEFDASPPPAAQRRLPISGPQMLAAREFADASEQAAATVAALRGVHIATRPSFWTSYEAAKPRVLLAARPLAELTQRRPDLMPRFEPALAGRAQDHARLRYLPVISRNRFWTAVLDGQTADVLALVPVDPY